MTEKTIDMPSREEWDRACKLIDFFAGYIGDMAPGPYADLFSDLNEHFITANRLKRANAEQPEAA